MAGIFSILPGDFFSPLASSNRETYAACLLIFYGLFRDSPGGVERSTLTARFAEHLAMSGEHLVAEEPSGLVVLQVEGGAAPDAGTDPGNGDTAPSEEDGPAPSASVAAEPADAASRSADPARAEASRIVRKLVATGWFGEEVLPDYTRLVTLSTRAKPFLDALHATDEGQSVEYESHIVAIYSSICSDAAKEYGHHAVLNAQHHLDLLVDSLKVLSQNIRSHYELLVQQSRDASIPEILKLHYDHYLEEVVDRAYARLKTSDNLSRYRPKIQRAVNAFRRDKSWMEKTAAALASIRRESPQEAKERLIGILDDIVGQLKALDPALEEIDRRNMLYARSSLERIRARLRSDSSAAGRLGILIKAIAGNQPLATRLGHHLYRVRWLGKESRILRKAHQDPLSFATRLVDAETQARESAALERADAELRLRIQRQLTPERIEAWLLECMGDRDFVMAQELATDAENFVRVLHATAYADARPRRFRFAVEWEEGEVEAAGWLFRAHGYRRRG